MIFIVTKRRQAGLTLIELMIVVVIGSILALIAIPNYQQHVRNSFRKEALAEVYDLVSEQERVLSQTGTYSASSFASKSGRYAITLVVNSANSFTVTLTAQGAQMQDTGCTTLTLDEFGNKTPANCWR